MLIARRLFLTARTAVPTAVHLTLGTLLTAAGLFLLGYCEDTKTEHAFYGVVCAGRGLQGLGNGYLLNLCTRC